MDNIINFPKLDTSNPPNESEIPCKVIDFLERRPIDLAPPFIRIGMLPAGGLFFYTKNQVSPWVLGRKLGSKSPPPIGFCFTCVVDTNEFIILKTETIVLGLEHIEDDPITPVPTTA